MTSSTNTRPALEPENWVSDHHATLSAVARAKLRDPEQVKDLVQETFLAAWKARHRFEGRSTERTWLTRILLNKIADFYRSAERKPSIAVSQLGNPDQLEESDLMDTLQHRDESKRAGNSQNPASRIEHLEYAALVDHYLQDIPKTAATAFRMREIDGLPTETVVSTLKITPNHLWVLIHRAKKALREKMEEHFDSQPVAGLLSQTA